MNAGHALMCLLAAFALVTHIEPWYQSWAGYTTRQGNVLQCLLGDSRRMLANHAFVEADVYFHGGYYPSVFDETDAFRTSHVSEDSGAEEGQNKGESHTFMGKPHDWIEALSRSFMPYEHAHLEASVQDEGQDEQEDHDGHEHHGEHCNHPDHNDDQVAKPASDSNSAREILPWLRTSVALDPQRVESYVVASYWLRERMGKVQEAETFLREGLLANPGSYELLYELGRSACDSRDAPDQARHLWQAAIKRWHASQDSAPEPDTFMLRNIYSDMARMEEEVGNLAQAHVYLLAAKAADGRHLYDMRIQRLEARMREAAPPP